MENHEQTPTPAPVRSGALGSLADAATGTELDQRVAEHVLGWKRPTSGQYWWTPPGSKHAAHLPCFSVDPAAALAVRDWMRGRIFSHRLRLAVQIQRELTKRVAPELIAAGNLIGMTAVLIMAEPEDWCRAALRWIEQENNEVCGQAGEDTQNQQKTAGRQRRSHTTDGLGCRD